jgi:hypothetical protein
METRPATLASTEQSESDCQNSGLLLLPRDCHLHLFSFLTQRRVARTGEVCKEMWRATRSASFGHLPLRDYQTEAGAHQAVPVMDLFPQGCEFQDIAFFSPTRAFIAAPEALLFTRYLDSTFTHPLVKEVLFRSNNKGKASLARLPNSNLVVYGTSKANSIQVYGEKDNCYFLTQQIPFASGALHQLIPLSRHVVAAVSKKLVEDRPVCTIEVFDINKPTAKACIRVIDFSASFKRLCFDSFGDMRLALYGMTNNMPVIKIFDLTREVDDQCVREISLKGEITALKFLSSKRIAYVWSANASALKQTVSLIDLTQKPGNEHAEELAFEHQSAGNNTPSLLRVKTLLPLPGSPQCCAAVFLDGGVKICDFRAMKVTPIWLHMKRRDDDHVAAITVHERGTLIGVTHQGTIVEQAFEWADERVAAPSVAGSKM